MDNNTYKNIQKLIVFFGIIAAIVINIRPVSSYIWRIVTLFTPFITGICIAFILNIPMQKIEKTINKLFGWKSSRAFSLFLTIIAFIMVLTLIFYMIIPEIVNSFVEIRNGLPTVVDNFVKFMKTPDNHIIKTMSNVGLDFDKMYSNVTNFFKNFSLLDATNALQSIFSATTNVFSSVMNVFLGLIFAVYILSQKEILLSQGHSLLKAIFPDKRTKKIVSFLRLVSSSFSKFIAGQGTEAVILCFLFLASMTLFHIPKAVSIATMIGLFSLVPIVGSFIAATYGVLSILIVAPIKSLWFVVLFLVLQQIEGNLIYPRVVGKSVGLPGVWVLLAITVGGNFAGITGMIMAVPTMSIVYNLVTSFVRSRNVRKTDGDKGSQVVDVETSVFEYLEIDEDDGNNDKISENTSNDNGNMGNEIAETSSYDKENIQDVIRSEKTKNSQQKKVKNKKK